MKGENSTYRPDAGTRCLISGPHMDDENGYVYMEMHILWRNDIFVLYGSPNCWPVLNKWDHVLAKPIVPTCACETPEPALLKGGLDSLCEKCYRLIAPVSVDAEHAEHLFQQRLRRQTT